MGGLFENPAEQAALENQELFQQQAAQGTAELAGLRTAFQGALGLPPGLRADTDPTQLRVSDLVAAFNEQPQTFDESLKQRLTGNLRNQIAENEQLEQKSSANQLDRLGLGRSSSGARGLSELSNLRAQSQNLGAQNQVDILAAQQRLPDMLRQIGLNQALLETFFGPTRELALGQLGSLQGIAGQGQGLAELAGNTASPFATALSGIGGLGLGVLGLPGVLGE